MPTDLSTIQTMMRDPAWSLKNAAESRRWLEAVSKARSTNMVDALRSLVATLQPVVEVMPDGWQKGVAQSVEQEALQALARIGTSGAIACALERMDAYPGPAVYALLRHDPRGAYDALSPHFESDGHVVPGPVLDDTLRWLVHGKLPKASRNDERWLQLAKTLTELLRDPVDRVWGTIPFRGLGLLEMLGGTDAEALIVSLTGTIGLADLMTPLLSLRTRRAEAHARLVALEPDFAAHDREGRSIYEYLLSALG